MIDIQFTMLCISIIYGAIMGVSYDGLRLLRRLIRHNNFFIGLEDIIYWIVWAFVVIDAIHIYNSGELRLYVYVGIFIGFLIYKNTIGWVVDKILSHILCLLRKHPKNHK